MMTHEWEGESFLVLLEGRFSLQGPDELVGGEGDITEKGPGETSGLVRGEIGRLGPGAQRRWGKHSAISMGREKGAGCHRGYLYQKTETRSGRRGGKTIKHASCEALPFPSQRKGGEGNRLRDDRCG